MQKQLTVRKIAAATPVTAAHVGEEMDKAGIEWHPIDIADWAEEWPYTPDVKFRIAHTGDSILIQYAVTEDSVRAVADCDHGRVWEDSCCEFFFSPEGNDTYYNVESNCAGRILLCCGAGREGRERAPQEVMSTIDRQSSLGAAPFEERNEKTSWQMAVVLPVKAFFKHDITSFDGMRSTANFYKCGDKLTKPHFLSWNKIEIAKPDFHRPDFFGQIDFE